MAKIDVSKIDGYAAMTAEQKIAALEAFDVEFDTTGFVKKDVYDKAASELSKLKKDLNEQGKTAQSSDEKIKDLEKELSVMKLEKKFIANGYTEEDAAKAANAYYDGDTDTVFALQQKNIESVKKAAAADAMKKTPPPKNGKSEGNSTTDYTKKIAEAQANGNFGEAAYYTRLQQSEEQNQTL